MRKISLLLFVFAFSAVPAFSQAVIREILNRMTVHQKALKSLQAEITITKFSAQSGEKQIKEGTVKFMPQANGFWLRIDSTKPVPEVFSMVGNQYLFYQPNQNIFYLPEVKVAHAGAMTDLQKNMFMIFTDLSRAKLKADYPSMTYIGVEKLNDTTATWHLKLTPKIAEKHKTLEVWVNSDGMPIQAKVTENNEDWTMVFLTKLQKNTSSIKPTDFKIDLPNGTKIIKN